MSETPQFRRPGNGLVPVPDRPPVPATYTEVPSYGSPDPGFEPEGSGLLDYWRILRRRKGTLILLASLGAVIGFLVTLPQTPIYQARTSVEIVGLNQNFLNVREVNPINDTGASSDSIDIQTQIRILQSQSLLDLVEEKVRAATPAAAPESRVSAWRKALNLPDPEPEDAKAQAIGFARSTLQVRAAGQTRIVELTVDSPDPAVAARFANTLSDEFIDQTLDSRLKNTEHTSDFLSRELDGIRIRLEQSEDRLQRYAQRAGLVFTNEDTNVSEQRLGQLQEALSSAQTDRILKQSRWETASSSPPDALPDILNDSTLRDYQAKLTDLSRQLAELRQTYKDERPEVRRVLAQIPPLEDALERNRADILKRIRNEYDEALRREKLIEADYSAQRSVVTGESEKAIQYSILKREVDSNRQLYDAMLQQLKQAGLASALRASNIRVVDPAKVPGSPYKPDVRRSSMLGMFAGLFLAVGFAIVREKANRSIQDPGETPMYLNLPELGVIPSEKGKPRTRTIKAARPNGQPSSAENGGPVADRIELVTMQRRPSAVAESFRATLVSILFSGSNGSRPRVLVVTSPNPGEGKSTVVSNLGIAVAEVNHRVLLIDADLRKPRLHDIFSLKNDCGLSDILRSKTGSLELPEGVVQETDIADLYVITSGPATSAATSLLYSNRMPELLKTLRTEFETILIDTPPMLQIPDSRVVGRLADRVVLVVRAGKTTRDAAQAACQRFSEDGIPILGTVLNDWDPRNSANGYYGYYSRYYGGGYYGRDGTYGSGAPKE